MKRKVFIDLQSCLEQVADSQELKLKSNLVASLATFKKSGFRLIILSDDELSSAETTWIDFLSDQSASIDDIIIWNKTASKDDSYGIDALEQFKIQSKETDPLKSYLVSRGGRFSDFAKLLEVKEIDFLELKDWQEIARLIVTEPRTAELTRKTKETEIFVKVNLDGKGISKCKTGIGFFDHMLDQLSKHSGIDMTVTVKGDLHIDDHHTIEDTAITIGHVIKKALGDKFAIGRYGFLLPMDETLCQVALDLSGRSFFVFEGKIAQTTLGEIFNPEMAEHFFRSFSDALSANLHIKVEGQNVHHQIEACFKGLAKALGQAVKRQENAGIPSTKGSL